MFIVAGALVLIVLGGLGGWAVASNQEYKKHSYLSDLFNVECTPTFADWSALKFTAANNSEGFLTDKLIRTGCLLLLMEHELEVFIGTHTQPDWNMYLGNGRFSVSDRELRAAYIEAVDEILSMIRTYFPEEESDLSDHEIAMYFAIHGTSVGTWQGGVFKLGGEE